MPKARIVLQARTTSERLPGKVLLPIRGMPLALLCARRLGRDGMDLVLATSRDPSDDLLARCARNAGITTCRGSLENVLERFAQACSDLDDTDVVVRATADNPVPDASFVAVLLERFKANSVDYLGTSSPLDGLPYGLSAEIMTVGALRRALRKAVDAADLEHVTPWIKRNRPSETAAGAALFGIARHEHLRCTVDSLEDYLRAESLFDGLDADPVEADWRLLVRALADRPDSPKFRVPFVCKGGVAQSRIALGTVQLGLQYGVVNTTGLPKADEARALLREAVQHGVSWIDTARAYGDAECRVGAALADGWQGRARVVTKLDPLDDLPDDASTLCVEHAVRASVLGSLQALRVNSIDTLLLHRWQHRRSHAGRIWKLLLKLAGEGIIKELGASVYQPAEAIDALASDELRHLQIPFNLLDRRWQDPAFQSALDKRPDVRIHVRSVFLQGLLLSDAVHWPSWDSGSAQRVAMMKQLVDEFGRESRADLCLAYVLAQPWVDAAVVGIETREQLRCCLSAACAAPLSAEQVALAGERFADVPRRLMNPSEW